MPARFRASASSEQVRPRKHRIKPATLQDQLASLRRHEEWIIDNMASPNAGEQKEWWGEHLARQRVLIAEYEERIRKEKEAK